MKLVSGIIIFFIFSLSALSEEIQAKLDLSFPQAVLKEGDIVEGLLRVWPIENADRDEFKKVENETWGNVLYVATVENVSESANNADVVEVKIVFIIKHGNEKNEQLIYKGQNIHIQIPQLKVAPLGKDTGEYYVLDQKIGHSILGKIIFGVFLAGVFVLSYIKRKDIQRYFKKFKQDPVAIQKKQFDEKFSLANTREEYEEIYALRSRWQGLVAAATSRCDHFFKVMELHQYKKNWSEKDLNEVRDSFDVIRGSFK